MTAANAAPAKKIDSVLCVCGKAIAREILVQVDGTLCQQLERRGLPAPGPGPAPDPVPGPSPVPVQAPVQNPRCIIPDCTACGDYQHECGNWLCNTHILGYL